MATQPTNLRGMREKINLATLPIGQTITLTLDDADQGVETPGKWGTQYRYMWSGNQISFLDPAIHEAIAATGAQPGDSISYRRDETRSGNKKGPIRHTVTLASEQQEEPAGSDWAQVPNDPIPPGKRTPQPAAWIKSLTDQAKALQTPDAARAAEPAKAPQPAAPAAMPRVEQATAATPPSVTHSAARLSAALVAAIDAAATAESYAEAHSRRLTFSSEDIRALGITAYIQETRK